jgi:eukaryotic-like serine/threonine-protein kinase
MTPERFQKIEELYHAAREASPSVRAALLAGTDPDLRHEIEVLLAQPSGGAFLDQPAFQNTADLLEVSIVAGLVAGSSLGPYRIKSQLGEGGMGQVFLAIDTRLSRPVAIKTTYEKFSARFGREARAISSLNHPNICTLFDVGPNYLVMELVEGETMVARLQRGPLPVATALLYASQVAAALAEAHAKGIVHRDLKPSNIMIAKSGVKVLDFGLAALQGDPTLTGEGAVIGTPAYMAPEQREGKPPDARSDIYAFGLVFYEMLTGERVPPQRKRLQGLRLERIVSRCLEVDPQCRWQSADELGRELATPGIGGTRWKIVPAAAAGVLVSLIASGYLYFHRAPKLTDKDTIVLADFVNNTGDPIFDGTLGQGLAIQLEQSPFLKIMDEGQVQRDLRLMNLQPGTRLTHQIVHDVCVREGGAATIDGEIANLGKSYVITLQAVACPDGAILAREQVQAGDKEDVLKALGGAAAAMRRKLGESLSSIQRLNRPLEQASTSSLDALQNYSAGISIMGQGHFRAAIPLFERAIAIDPTFAMAYYYRGVAYEQAGDMERSAEDSKRAFSLVDRVSETERTDITAYYYRFTGELDKEIDAWQWSVRNYPRKWNPHTQLSLTYIDMGQFEEGLKEGVESVRLEPHVEPPWRRPLDALMCLNRLTEAEAVEAKVRTLGIDGPRIHQRFLELAYLEDDQSAVAREIQWFAGKPEEYLSFGLQAAWLNMHGQRFESHQLYRRAADTARRQGLQYVADDFDEADARADALSGRCQAAHRLGRPALALAMCGDTAEAAKLAAETSRIYPSGTIWTAVQLPEIEAMIALRSDEPAKGIELMTSASPYERAYPDAVYVRGLVYLRMKKGTEAATEFHKIADHEGASWGATWIHPYWGQYYSLAYLGMARGYALASEENKAKAAYENFFELWKDAEPDLPVLREARAEYAKLR